MRAAQHSTARLYTCSAAQHPVAQRSILHRIAAQSSAARLSPARPATNTTINIAAAPGWGPMLLKPCHVACRYSFWDPAEKRRSEPLFPPPPPYSTLRHHPHSTLPPRPNCLV